MRNPRKPSNAPSLDGFTGKETIQVAKAVPTSKSDANRRPAFDARSDPKRDPCRVSTAIYPGNLLDDPYVGMGTPPTPSDHKDKTCRSEDPNLRSTNLGEAIWTPIQTTSEIPMFNKQANE